MKNKILVTCFCVAFALTLFPTSSHGDWKAFENLTTLDDDKGDFDNLIERYLNRYDDQITKECLAANETQDDDELTRKRNKILDDAEQENKRWDKKYFELVTALHDAQTRDQKFTSLTTEKEQLNKLIKRLEDNIRSIKEIYKNRLRAVPTAYLLFSEITGNTDTETTNKTFKDLDDAAKEFLKTYTPTFITSEIRVKNLRIIGDVITATKSGRIVPFESDPLRHMAKNDKFFLLQKYRIYPDFSESEEIKKKEKTGNYNRPEDYKPTIIDRPVNDNDTIVPPEFFKNKEENLTELNDKFNQIKEFNDDQSKRLKEINKEYEKVTQPVLTKMEKNKKALSLKRQQLEDDYRGESKTTLKHKINISETKLNQHVRERVMILVTAPADHVTKEMTANEMFGKLAKSSFMNLLYRARELKTYKFFVVENHNLKYKQAYSFYTNPIPIEFNIPLRRKKYFGESLEGYHRCNVVFGLKVKFSSKIKKEDFPELPEDERENKFGMTFKFVEPGTFIMGSPEDEPERKDNEKQHVVTLDNGFYMQETEVTKEQWKAIMGFEDKLSHSSRCLKKQKGKDHPMEHVRWDDTQRFINKLNGMGKEKYRLPTEAEWEYACRAGTTTPFALGKNLTRNANFDDGSPGIRRTTPVKNYDPNHWGLYDMHGNVSEWCNDYYDEYTDGIKNPTGPSSSKSMKKVIRGGDYRDHANNCRSAFRGGAMRSYKTGTLGFRLVMIP